MTEIYVSYSRLDHERVKPLIERLQSLGYTVSRGDAIVAAPESAPTTLVLWSASARNSAQVTAQAALALDQGKLVQARLDPVAPPAPFDALASANLSSTAAEYGALEDALARVARGEDVALANNKASSAWWSTPECLGAPKSVAFATIAAVCAFAGAISAVQNGLMPPAPLQTILWGCIGVSVLCAMLGGLRRFMLWRAG